MNSSQDRLNACWGISDCQNCIHDPHGCGWCPTSSACIPASSLLEPISRNVCPYRGERYELRTKTLGCNCSTTTFLSVFATVWITIAAIIALSIILRGLRYCNDTFGSGTWRGLEVEIKGHGARVERQWKQGSWFGNLGRQLTGGSLSSNRSEQEQRTERSRLLG